MSLEQFKSREWTPDAGFELPPFLTFLAPVLNKVLFFSSGTTLLNFKDGGMGVIPEEEWPNNGAKRLRVHYRHNNGQYVPFDHDLRNGT